MLARNAAQFQRDNPFRFYFSDTKREEKKNINFCVRYAKSLKIRDFATEE
jgi:hypothetical protein